MPLDGVLPRVAIGGFQDRVDMLAKRQSFGRKWWPVLRRRVGALACALALLGAPYGHAETSEAAPAGIEHVLVTTASTTAPTGHRDAIAHHHCLHYGQCSFHAVLPGGTPIEISGALGQRPSGKHMASSRVISPLRHPPKVRTVL